MPQPLRIQLRLSPKLRRNLTNHPYLIGGPVRDFLTRAAVAVHGEAVSEAPVDTGRLRSSHAWAVEAAPIPNFARVGVNVAYGRFVHDGTRAHVITPSRKRALFWPGARHPVASVNHPGTAPNPWLERALRQAAGAVRRAAERLASDVEGRWGA